MAMSRIERLQFAEEDARMRRERSPGDPAAVRAHRQALDELTEANRQRRLKVSRKVRPSTIGMGLGDGI